MLRKKKIVRSRAPLRLGLAGGGTDVEPYASDFGGKILNATINKYAYVSIESRQDNVVEFSATDCQKNYKGSASFPLPIIKGLELPCGVYNRIMNDYCDKTPIALNIYTYSEVPPGSGLGSSSTMVVALIQAFVELLSIPLGEYDIAKLAYEIEREDLGFSGGKQDQYAASFGGVNFMEFYSDRVIVNPLRIKKDILLEFESSLILYYTGATRSSAEIILNQVESVRNKVVTNIEAMHAVKLEATLMKEALLKGDFKSMIASLQSGWKSKKKMAHGISNSHIDDIYQKSIACGALAGKISGAGGGGYMFFIASPGKRSIVINELNKIGGHAMTCQLSSTGAEAWSAKDD